MQMTMSLLADFVQDQADTVLRGAGVVVNKSVIYFKLHSIKHVLLTPSCYSSRDSRDLDLSAHIVDYMNYCYSTEFAFYDIPQCTCCQSFKLLLLCPVQWSYPLWQKDVNGKNLGIQKDSGLCQYLLIQPIFGTHSSSVNPTILIKMDGCIFLLQFCLCHICL